MKGLILSLAVMSFTIIAVTVNAIVLDKIIGEITCEIEAIEFSYEGADGAEVFKRSFEHYKSAERYISLTVSHDDLTNIEGDFYEILGCIKVNDLETAGIAKSRLEGSLRHLWRLSSLNIDSII
jgi:hypothetical protein